MTTRLRENASSSVVQFLVNSIVLFVFYKFLLKTIGAKDIGVWALVLGISSFSQMAAFGFSGGAVKYVAQYLSRQREDKVIAVIQTSLLSAGVLVGIFALLGYQLLRIFVIHVVGTENAFKVEQILPLGMVSLWLMALVNVVFSCLDGYQRMYLRNFILMGSSVVNLILCFIVVPRFHLLGLAYLSLFQNSLLIVSGWFVLRHLNRALPIVPMHWDKRVFREVIGYNLQFQFISFTAMLCEPATKYFLGIFGGIASVGYYDMANRLSGQVRGVLVSANQALVPVFANYAEQDMQKVLGIYKNSFQLLLFITLPAYCVLLLGVPLISQLWIGSVNEIFILALFSLFVAHMINILSNPAYFANVGSGALKSNMIAHAGMAIISLLLAYFFGTFWGGRGVIIAWPIALIMGSVYILLSYNRAHKITIREILPGNLVRLAIFAFGVFFVGEICLWMSRTYGGLAVNVLVISIAAGGLLYQQWKNPFFGKILSFIQKKVKQFQ